MYANWYNNYMPWVPQVHIVTFNNGGLYGYVMFITEVPFYQWFVHVGIFFNLPHKCSEVFPILTRI